jgi:EAL domain-containing protein (putative c-di-GMP-specific phosphodiesterase class I)
MTWQSDCLELELTESVLLETTKRHSVVLERLRRAGVRLAIDDFGTGYSSLDYLRAYHVSRLKIDRRFIDDVTSNADNGAITRATIGLAHALGIDVVAEGVETPAQHDFLLKAGCTLAQGYLSASRCRRNGRARCCGGTSWPRRISGFAYASPTSSRRLRSEASE